MQSFIPSMSRARSPSDRRPPLPASPRRTRARRNLCSTSIPTPLASLAKTQLPNHLLGLQQSRFRPELLSMSCEFRALAKMVEEGFESSGLDTPFIATPSTKCSPLFERGRMYDEYSARRNERLKRKKGEVEEERSVNDSGVSALEFGKRRNAKKTEIVRKSVPANFSIGRREGLRSSVRISKENKKPVLSETGERSGLDGDKKKRIGAVTGRRN